MSRQFKILDCTLRDGGYYNQWDFDTTQAERLIAGLNSAGVDIIEVGYKSLPKKGYYGLFRYCNEKYLSFLSKYTASEYAFMIDAAEFIRNGKVMVEELDKIIFNENESYFSWVRIASHYKTIEQVPELVTYFIEKGYQIGFNLMGGSLLQESELIYALEKIQSAPIEVFYIADSFGSFYPKDMQNILRTIQAHYNGKIGVHTHDNQGMAYANTMAALEMNVDFVDGTVTGMGRGAGNLSTEQFLLGQSVENEDLNPNALLGVIHEYIEPLKKEHQWGYNYSYMLSGLQNIHPTYCQKLSEGNKMSIHQISDILSKIPKENRTKFSEECLKKVMREKFSEPSKSKNGILLNKVKVEDKNKGALIVARGPSAHSIAKDLVVFSEDQNIPLMECNHTGLFDTFKNRRLILFNKMRFSSFLRKNQNIPERIVTGEKYIEETIQNIDLTKIDSLDYEIGNLEFNESKIKIPAFEAGQFAIAYAIVNGAKTIYIAGFDGYHEVEKNKVMDDFFKQVQNQFGVRIISLSSTHYAHIEASSVFAF